MAETTVDRLLALLSSQGETASKERTEQSEAFAKAIQGLRWEIRTILIIIVVLAAARDGVLTHLNVGKDGFVLNTSATPTPTPTPTPTAAAPALPSASSDQTPDAAAAPTDASPTPSIDL